MRRVEIGIDLGGSHIAIAVIDVDGKIIEKNETRLTKNEKKDIEKSIEEYIIQYTNQFKQKYDITGMGIAMPGWAENGVIKTSGNLGIENYPIVERLQEIQLPIKIQNDAKCAAIAENEYGCLKGCNRTVFLTLGTGIGGAVFLNHQLLNAGKKPGYEFGHMVIEKNGIPCHCGKRGCFERYASMKVFKDKLRNAFNLDETVSGEKLLEMIRKSDSHKEDNPVVENVITEYIENLSIGIQNLICIFEPQVIGIGGSFTYFEDILLERLRKKIKEINVKYEERKEIEIKIANMGNDAGIIGAVL